MDWLVHTFEKYPEAGVYLAVGLGCLFGKLKFRGFSLGLITSSLLAGILIGTLVHVPVSDQAKSMMFLLFLFGIGYSVGPSFFRNLKGEGWRWAVLAVFVPVVGLISAYIVARILRLDVGFSAGILSGGLSESPALGTASEAIRNLQISEEQKLLFTGHLAVADAICYVFGTVGVIWCCTAIAPKLFGIDLRAEAKKEEAKLGIKHTKTGISSAWQPIGFRAYTIPKNAPVVGKTVADAEQSVSDARLFVERIRRQQEIFSPSASTILEAGDTVAVVGRTDILVKVLGPTSTETADPDLLDIPVASFDLYVTSENIAGKTLQQIADTVHEARGVLLRGLTRDEQPLPVGSNVVVQRGDILHVTGAEEAIERLAPIVGRKIPNHEDSDLAVLSLAIVFGILTGAAIQFPIAGMHIGLGTSVATLLAGLLVGWGRSRKPWFAHIPDSVILFLRSMGLAAFVAMIGLKAGPIFVSALRQAGLEIFLGGVFVTLIPALSGLLFGHYVLRLDSIQLLGGVAGAQTVTAAMAAVQEESGSPVPTLGYSYTAAIGHILLTTWGTVIVSLLT